MSATDELRRLLDEHGIKHDDEFVKCSLPYCDGYEATYWGSDLFGYVEPIRPKPNTVGSHPELTIHDCTPAQAIAATLGAGECEIVETWSDSDFINDWNYKCSECGAFIDVYERDPKTGEVFSSANYCPCCGRKVKK